MNEQLFTSLLNGGGVLAFAGAIWLSQREILRTLRAIEKVLAKLEERDEYRRELAQTPPLGVPVLAPRRRKHNDTDEE